MDSKELELVQQLWDAFDNLVTVVDNDNRCFMLVTDTKLHKKIRSDLREMGDRIEGKA